jgi:hypothetical protein
MVGERDLRAAPSIAPRSGDNEETVVFSCLNQDKRLDYVDFSVLRMRLGQNAPQGRLTGARLKGRLSSNIDVTFATGIHTRNHLWSVS